MPNFETHCKISQKRTHNEFKALHKWMDEATKYLGQDHRIERHFYTQEYKDFINKEWGSKAVVEWLFHIALDNMETANKFAVDIYNKNFAEISVSFDEKKVSECVFTKVYPNSKSSITINLKERLKKKGEDFVDEDRGNKLWTAEDLKLMGFNDLEAEWFSDI